MPSKDECGNTNDLLGRVDHRTVETQCFINTSFVLEANVADERVRLQNMYVKVAKASDIPDPGKQYFEIDERLVVLFHVGGSFYCLDDVCTHDGGPLGEGVLEGETIACPRHGAKFNIKTGKALTMPATVDTMAHQVRVDGDDVLIELTEQ
jgi:3-phenylpropionate/trans-cinnamate dioxygenase ferredoxin subunit